MINDDAYFRLHFSGDERSRVAEAVVRVTAPRTLRDLIRIKARGRLGMLQLRESFPYLYAADQRSKGYARVVARILRRPALLLAAPLYVALALVVRVRAARQLRRLSAYQWERDNSSRS